MVPMLFTSLFFEGAASPGSTSTTTTASASTTTTASASSTSTSTSTASSDHYITDFSGTSPLDDWTGGWDSGNLSTSIVNAANDARVGSKDLAFGGSSASRKYYSFDPAGSSVTDCDVLALINAEDVYLNDSCIMIGLRMGGSSGSEDGYFVNFLDDRIRCGVYSGGVNTQLTSVSEEGFNIYSSSVPMWIRVQIEGYTIRVKVWNYYYFEPSEWAYSVTDGSSSVASGKVGLINYSSGNVDCMWYGVSTDINDPVSVPALTYGVDSVVRMGCHAPFSVAIDAAINWARLFPFPISAAANGRYVSKVRWYSGNNVSTDVRPAIYKGSTIDDPTDASLVEDFGIYSPSGTRTWQTHHLSTYEQVSTGDIIYFGLKGDGNGSDIVYFDNPLKGMDLVANGSGRWQIDSGESNDDTSAWSASLSGDSVSQANYWFAIQIFLSDSASTTTTTS